MSPDCRDEYRYPGVLNHTYEAEQRPIPRTNPTAATAAPQAGPGWYECRIPDDDVFSVRWFDGESLRENKDEGFRESIADYTDFRPLGVPVQVEPMAWAVMCLRGEYDYRVFHDQTEAEDFAQEQVLKEGDEEMPVIPLAPSASDRAASEEW